MAIIAIVGGMVGFGTTTCVPRICHYKNPGGHQSGNYSGMGRCWHSGHISDLKPDTAPHCATGYNIIYIDFKIQIFLITYLYKIYFNSTKLWCCIALNI